MASALIESVFLSTSISASVFISNGQAETTAIPITLSFTSPVPYTATVSETATATATATSKSSFPILPVAAAGSGGLALVIVAVALYLVCQRRRRRSTLHSGKPSKTRPDLDAELPRGEIAGSRTFSRLTYSAPYTVPHSSRTLSTAAPSTVSIGQQYRTTVRTPGRR